MGPKRFQSQKFSLFIVKFKKLGFSAPLRLFGLKTVFFETSRPSKTNTALAKTKTKASNMVLRPVLRITSLIRQPAKRIITSTKLARPLEGRLGNDW